MNRPDRPQTFSGPGELIEAMRPENGLLKNVVVNIGVSDESDATVNYAISIAEAFDAHLTAVAFAHDPIVPETIFDGFAADLAATYRGQVLKAANAAKRRFDEAVRLAGIAAESHLLDATVPGAADMFGQIARRYDLSVVAQGKPDKSPLEELIIEAALFESGRPVLVVPYIQKAGFTCDRPLVCWDGSRNAARAIGDALPFLLRAKAIDVVIVASERSKSSELPGADIGRHFARHRLKVEVKRIVREDVDVPNAILSHAADISADLIVMGGYGHSRLREFVLGGATRGILTSMTVPTLMSH